MRRFISPAQDSENGLEKVTSRNTSLHISLCICVKYKWQLMLEIYKYGHIVWAPVPFIALTEVIYISALPISLFSPPSLSSASSLAFRLA